MTPLQQAYLAKLHATAVANLEFMRVHLKEVHALIARDNPAASVDVSEQGDLVIRHDDGREIPVARYLVELEEEFVRFADPAQRTQLVAFHPLRLVEENPGHGDMQRYHYSNVDAEFPNRARRHFNEHYPDERGLSPYPSFGGAREIPLLLVLGSGLGLHLDRLLRAYRVRHLVVLEPDADAFRLSLFFQDYVALSRLAVEKGTDLSFIVGEEIEHLSRGLLAVLRRHLPPFFIHGAALFFAMPDGETRQALIQAITTTLWELYFGLGYFDDELISVAHTLRNLGRSELPVYQRQRVVPEGAVAFIIGSGPSLDGLLPLLAAHREEAVLFSCGTALGPLAHAGIVPDFHLEKERPGIVYDVLTRTVPEDFRRQVRLLALNVVMPEVLDLFREAAIVLKERDTMGTVLEASGQLRRVPIDSQPTVTNMALSVALTLGFREIYLFGVDMGYRLPERHHSRHTAYLGRLPEAEHLRRLLSRRPGADKAVPGNFGGEVRTDNILHMARLHLEQALFYFPDARVYNLNDGALIRGAEPLEPEDFPPALGGPSKAAVLAAIEGAFSPAPADRMAVASMLLADLDAAIESIAAFLDRPFAGRQAVIDALVEVYFFLQSPEFRDRPASAMFQGTIVLLLSLTYNMLSVIADDDEAVAKAQWDFANLLDALSTARAEVLHAIRGALPDFPDLP